VGIRLAGRALASLSARTTPRQLFATIFAGEDGRDCAYLELYRAAKDSIATQYKADPYDLGIHAAMPDVDFMNRGVASYVLPYLVASVLGQEPLCRRIMFDPDHRNKQARRFCERAGCVFLGEHDMSNR
jgi:RimJ/RimL family protein N-acetyltransferase